MNGIYVEGDTAGAAVRAGLLALALHQGHLPSPPLPLPPHQDLPHPQVKPPLSTANSFITQKEIAFKGTGSEDGVRVSRGSSLK
jgi:hypothetical protein